MSNPFPRRRAIPLFLLAVLAMQAGLSAADSRPQSPTLPAPIGWAVPDPAPALPTAAFEPPIAAEAKVLNGAPEIFEFTPDAGPDQTFFATGSGLTANLFAWGVSAVQNGGQAWALKVQFAQDKYLAATLPQKSFDGPVLVWAKNDAGWSRPIRLNVPQPWWCAPASAPAGQVVRIFGRDLSRRPDRSVAYVYLQQPGKPGTWLETLQIGKYDVAVRLPKNLATGSYQLWVHAGLGGHFAWGGPLHLNIIEPPKNGPIIELAAGPDEQLRKAIDDLAEKGGGTLALGEGVFTFRGTLRVPANVTLAGKGSANTRLQLVHQLGARFASSNISGWGKAPGAIHTPGDTMEYRATFPAAGNYTVWVRYATEMAKYKLDGMSGRTSMQVDDQPPAPLQDMPNTGSFGTFRWAKVASINIPAGAHTLLWRNDKGGGITLDAFVFSRDPAYVPADQPWPVSGDKLVVVQAEDVSRFTTKDGTLPGGDAPAIWLAGDDASLRDLTISANPQANIGVLIGAPDALKTIEGCKVERVRVVDVEGKSGENCGVRIHNASGAIVRDCELWGRSPFFFSGAVRSQFVGNRLVSVTRFGGNAEAAIQSRCERLEQCIIENNRIASPPGAEAGGPTARRLVWFSTGRGSVTHNYIAGNGVEAATGPGASVGAGQARFGGVAGTDQNVGEMILFEGNHRTMFFGAPASADATSVTPPRNVPATPDHRLGNVKRQQLAHDSAGNETPFWPPDDFDNSDEPPIHQYYVSIFSGPGQGQSRRVLKRDGEKLLLDRPWTTAPDSSSVIAVGTAFYQNLITGNHTPDGMTGIQLWISCIENVVSNNTIARQRKQGIFLYGNGTTLASSMPRTWNRGISPLFFNHVEGTRADECSDGALVTSGDGPDMPIEFPRALGNVLRHNSLLRSRTQGVILSARPPQPAKGDKSPSIVGTVVEFNVMRDAMIGYRATGGSDNSILRRNHAYFWYPVANTAQAPIGFQVDAAESTTVIDENTVEGKNGVMDRSVVEIQKGPPKK